MEYITARAQPTPKAKPRKTPMRVGQREFIALGVYRVLGVDERPSRLRGPARDEGALEPLASAQRAKPRRLL
jgi:hypothetical protein